MIAASLIPDSAAEVFGETNEERFLRVAKIARANYEDAISATNEVDGYTPAEWRAQYVHEVSAVASALGIGGLPNPDNSVTTPQNLAAFDATLARILTRIRFSITEPAKDESVTLSFVTKQTIRSDLEGLRDTINRANIPESLKETLHARVNDVEAELDKRRSRLAPIWILQGALALLNVGSTTVGVLADAQPASAYVQSISEAVVKDKAAEMAEEARLTQSQKLLTHEPQKAIEDRSAHGK